MPLVAEHTQSDEELVRQAVHGNERAFTELVSRHKGWVLALAAKFCLNSHEADDLAQKIFIRAYTKLPSYRAISPFKNWLSRLATNCALDHLRWKRARSWLTFLPVGTRDDESPTLPDVAEYPLQKPHPLVSRLVSALEKLSARDRMLITLLEIEDRSVAEVASLLGWSESNVKTRAHRIRNHLKKTLQRATEEL